MFVQKKIIYIIGIIIFAAFVACFITYFIIRAVPQDYSHLTTLKPNRDNGLYLLKIAGCIGCHENTNAPRAQTQQAHHYAQYDLSGGYAIKSPFGVFHVPNISSDPVYGIGAWSIQDLANALQQGISPAAQYYYPSLPFPHYHYLTDQDVVDLFAILQLQPQSNVQQKAHELGFPFNMRLLMGGWKFLFMAKAPLDKRFPIIEDRADIDPALLVRGRYLTEAVLHCAACHSPRGIFGEQSDQNHLQGGVDGVGKKVPAIDAKTLKNKDYDHETLIFALQTGILPDGDVLAGDMEDFINHSLSHLSSKDMEAVATYLLRE